MNKIMYIAVLDTVPKDKIPILIANTVLEYHKIYGYQEPGSDYDCWFFISTKKELILVNEAQLEQITLLPSAETFFDFSVQSDAACCTILIVDGNNIPPLLTKK